MSWLIGNPLQGREACIAGRALRDGGAMKGGAARSLGENEERNKLPWQRGQFRCVRGKWQSLVEKLSKLSTASTDDVNKIDGYRAVRQRC